MSFDGIDDYVDFGNGLGLQREYTIEFWLKWKGFTGSHAPIFKSRGTSQADIFLTISQSQGSLLFSAYEGSSANWPAYTLWVAYPPQNKWTHIVAVASDVNLKVYYNSDLKASKTLGAVSITSVSELCRIGIYSTYNFNGLIDEVHVYKEAFSKEAVKERYLAELERHQN